MSTYSYRLQPVLQNLLQRVVWFFHPRSSCRTHLTAEVSAEENQKITRKATDAAENIELFGSFFRDRWRSIYRRTFRE